MRPGLGLPEGLLLPALGCHPFLSHPADGLVSILSHSLFSALKVKSPPFLPSLLYLQLPQCFGVSLGLRPSPSHSDTNLTLCNTPCLFPSISSPSLPSMAAPLGQPLPISSLPPILPLSCTALGCCHGRRAGKEGLEDGSTSAAEAGD